MSTLHVHKVTLSILGAKLQLLGSGKENFIGRSTPQTSMDIDNGNIGSPKKISLSKRKRKANSEIVSCTIPKESICFYCQEKGHWLQSCSDYLKDLRKVRIETFDSASGKSTI